MSCIKSITTVRAHGAGNNGNWVARMRFTDGSELFGGVGAGYTMHQAEKFANNNRNNHPFSGELPYSSLPAGVVITND